jgi:hypothetical protein
MGRRWIVDHPLNELLKVAERAYVRMEAEQLIEDCLHHGDVSSFDNLVEELVLAGASSLEVLREILLVIRARKSDAGQEGINVRQDLMDALAEFDLEIPSTLQGSPVDARLRICADELSEEVRRSMDQLNAEDAFLVQEICREAGRRVEKIAYQVAMLSKLEASVLDWIDGLAYESAHAFDDAWPRYGHIAH